jgi:hypothetical protein
VRHMLGVDAGAISTTTLIGSGESSYLVFSVWAWLISRYSCTKRYATMME